MDTGAKAHIDHGEEEDITTKEAIAIGEAGEVRIAIEARKAVRRQAGREDIGQFVAAESRVHAGTVRVDHAY